MSLLSRSPRCPQCSTRLHELHQGACPGCGLDLNTLEEDGGQRATRLSHSELPGAGEAARSAAPLPPAASDVGSPSGSGDWGRIRLVRVPRKVLIRDFLIFQLKLYLDAFGDLIFSVAGTVALVLDLIFGGRRPGRLFYYVLRLGERWDLWLSLYRAAKDAEITSDGLFGASRRGADTMLGKLEEMVRKQDLVEHLEKIKPPRGFGGRDRRKADEDAAKEGWDGEGWDE